MLQVKNGTQQNRKTPAAEKKKTKKKCCVNSWKIGKICLFNYFSIFSLLLL
jgi:hypothetical protein